MCLKSFLLPTCTPVSDPTSEFGYKLARGNNVTIDHFPFQAAIFNRTENKLICGATILSQFVLLTAAHCIFRRKPSSLFVVAGSTNHSSVGGTEQRIPVARILTHEGFGKNLRSPEDDIGLVFLSSPLNFTENVVNNISIPKVPTCYSGNGTVSGWGKTESKETPFSDLLQYSVIPLVPTAECNKKYKTLRISDKFICAYKNGSDACHGDSGGPLSGFVNGSRIIVGVVSGGSPACGNENGFPGLYINVSKYASWILARMNEMKSRLRGLNREDELCTPYQTPV